MFSFQNLMDCNMPSFNDTSGAHPNSDSARKLSSKIEKSTLGLSNSNSRETALTTAPSSLTFLQVVFQPFP